MHFNNAALRFAAMIPQPQVIFHAQGFGYHTPEAYAAERHGQRFIDQLKGFDLSQCPNVDILVDTTEKGCAVTYGPDQTRVYVTQRGKKEPFAVLDPSKRNGLGKRDRKAWLARLKDVPFTTEARTWTERLTGDNFRIFLAKVRDIAWLAEKEFQPTIQYAPEVEQSPAGDWIKGRVNDLLEAIDGMKILKEAGGRLTVSILPGADVTHGDFVFKVDTNDGLRHPDIDTAGGSSPFFNWKFSPDNKQATLENFKTDGLGKALLRMYHFGVKDLAPIAGDKIYHPRGQRPR